MGSHAPLRIFIQHIVQKILALKFLGLPLKEILAALEQTPQELPQALRMQRRALLENQARVRRAIRAIEAAERALEAGELAGTSALKKIIEVINYEEGPGPEWRALYRDAAEVQDAIEIMRRYYSTDEDKGSYQHKISRVLFRLNEVGPRLAGIAPQTFPGRSF